MLSLHRQGSWAHFGNVPEHAEPAGRLGEADTEPLAVLETSPCPEPQEPQSYSTQADVPELLLIR